LKASVYRYPLNFKKPSQTSRNTLTAHKATFIKLEANGQIGYGEASPLAGLSIDDLPDFDTLVDNVVLQINEGMSIQQLDITHLPSLVFALETAQAGIENKKPFTIYNNAFVTGTPIAINGLIWMNNAETMFNDAVEKLQQGFHTLKFKVGALDFDEECRLLEKVRKLAPSENYTIRLDANGAFRADDALKKLIELSRFHIHSIEQPVKAKQLDLGEEICARSPIPIALDEELIGINVFYEGNSLLKKIKPAYVILKPTLIGGFKVGDAWIKLSQKHNIGWWATSALESNIGLNAISQWSMSHHPSIPQGLGTGSLYTNNIESPLKVSNGYIKYDNATIWNLPF